MELENFASSVVDSRVAKNVHSELGEGNFNYVALVFFSMHGNNEVIPEWGMGRRRMLAAAGAKIYLTHKFG